MQRCVVVLTNEVCILMYDGSRSDSTIISGYSVRNVENALLGVGTRSKERKSVHSFQGNHHRFTYAGALKNKGQRFTKPMRICQEIVHEVDNQQEKSPGVRALTFAKRVGSLQLQLYWVFNGAPAVLIRVKYRNISCRLASE